MREGLALRIRKDDLLEGECGQHVEFAVARKSRVAEETVSLDHHPLAKGHHATVTLDLRVN